MPPPGRRRKGQPGGIDPPVGAYWLTKVLTLLGSM